MNMQEINVTDDYPIHVGRSRKKALKSVLLGLALLVASVLSVVVASSTVVNVIGGVGAVMFGSFLIVTIKNVFDRSSVLTIDAEGFIDNTSMFPAGRIYWSEVKEIKIATVMRSSMIAVMVHNPSEVLSRNGKRSKANKLDEKLTGTSINLVDTDAALTVDEMVALLHQGMERFAKENAS